jgi:hypothetical protein
VPGHLRKPTLPAAEVHHPPYFPHAGVHCIETLP